MKGRSFKKCMIAWIVITAIELLRIRELQSFGDVVLTIFWWIDFRNGNRFIQSVILAMLPQILIMLFWGDYFEEMVYRNASLLLPRRKSVYMILKKFYCKLMLRIVFCIVAWSGIIYAFCALKGNYVLGIEDGINVLLYIVYIIQLLVFMNLVSIIDSSIIGTLLGILVQMASLMLIHVMYESGVEKMKWLPSYIFWLCQKPDSVLQKIMELIYLVGIICIFFVINCWVMKRKEWR